VVFASSPSVYAKKGGAVFIITERADASRLKKQTPFSPFKKSEGEKGMQFTNRVLRVQRGCRLCWRLRCLTIKEKDDVKRSQRFQGAFGPARCVWSDGRKAERAHSEGRPLCARIQGDELH
jgi:hypothetical protein